MTLPVNAFPVFAAEEELFYAALTSGNTDVNAVALSWQVPAVQFSCKESAVWDTENLQWVYTQYDGQLVNLQPASFTFENYSAETVVVTASFTPTNGMENLAIGADFSYGEEKEILTAGGLELEAARQSDGTLNLETYYTDTVYADLHIVEDDSLYAALKKTEESGLALGTYTLTISDVFYPFEQMRNRYISAVKAGTVSVFAYPAESHSARHFMEKAVVQNDGTAKFSDVNYKSSSFKIISEHLYRTLFLASYYSSAPMGENRTNIGNRVAALLEYWVQNDYTDSNWWYNKISTPNILGEICLLARDAISDELLQRVLPIMGRGCYTVDTSTLNETGANAAWLAFVTLKYGILNCDKSCITAVTDELKSELGYSASGDGIKSDNTFMQHGARLYSGGYGTALVKNLTSILYLLEDSAYQPTQEDLAAFAAMICNGLRYMSIGNLIDPQTVGREISRENATDISKLVSNLRLLKTLSAMPQKEEINEYLAAIENNTRADLGLKYFNISNYLVINNSDFYFSFRGCDKTLYYAENLNNENVLSYHSSFGTVTTIAGTNVDFNGIQPIMDYSLIPGTTAPYETDAELLTHTDYNTRKLTGKFYERNFSDGCALSAQQFSLDGTNRTVACFATGNSAVILGAGLSNDDGKELITTLQQELYQGSYTKNGNTVIHNGVKYVQYAGGTLTAKAETKTGSWSRNAASGSTASVSGEVFTLTMENTGSYAYAVMSTNTNDSYTVLVNTTSIQAVLMPNGRLCAVFYVGGSSFTYKGVKYEGKTGTVHYFEV